MLRTRRLLSTSVVAACIVCVVPSTSQAQSVVRPTPKAPAVSVTLAPREVKFAVHSTFSINGKVISTSSQTSPIVVAASGGGPTGTTIYCDHTYGFGDSNGSISLQHACGGSTTPWGYKISSVVCATATSPVHEAGMYWARNGGVQPLQAPHDYPCLGTTFHGTFNPARDNDHIAYSDVFTWLVAGDGHAQLQIYGSFILSPKPIGNCGVRTSKALKPAC
jgi:hypothetical protein